MTELKCSLASTCELVDQVERTIKHSEATSQGLHDGSAVLQCCLCSAAAEKAGAACTGQLCSMPVAVPITGRLLVASGTADSCYTALGVERGVAALRLSAAYAVKASILRHAHAEPVAAAVSAAAAAVAEQ
eukprot:20873-Heterococcus_DN1.PRE.1